MSASKRIGAIRELAVRLAKIERPDYWTDAGKSITLGEAPAFGDGDPDTAIAIMVGDSSDSRQGLSETYVCLLPVSIQAFAAAAPKDGTDPFETVEQLVADIKRAVEREEPTLAGWCLPTPGISRTGVRAIPRQPGAEFVGAAVDYILPFEELWGKP